MKTTNEGRYACSESCVCESTVLCRPRYFPRQLITPEEMILEAQYFRDKLRRHNCLMHGWGVVCGAIVCHAPKCDNPKENEQWKVVVKPGYILGPCGDEIVIECDQVVDLRTASVTGLSGEPCPEPPDPWCNPATETKEPRTVYIAVKYKE